MIKIGEKEYPVKFGYGALAKFCHDKGISLNDMGDLGGNLDLWEMIQLAHRGIEHGCKREGIDCDITPDKLADSMDDDPELLTKIMEEFSSAFPQGNVTGGKV